MGNVDSNRRQADRPEAGSRYPRGWARNAGFTGWKIAVAAVMLVAVPAAIWLVITFLVR